MTASVLLLAAAIAIYTINLDRPPFPDELYHVLAAQGLLASGRPEIVDGLYVRGLPQTWLVALSFRVFGTSLVAARLPSVIASALTVVLLFLWLQRHVGFRLAVVTALFFMLSPFTIPIAQLCRFYALQTLSFFVGAILVFEASAPLRSPGLRIALLSSSVLLLGFAVHLQPVTALGVVALCVYLFVVVGRSWFQRFPGHSLHLALGIASVVGAVALVLYPWYHEFIGQAIARYRWVAPFNAHDKNTFWYYHAWYLLFFPGVWPATGFLVMSAIGRWPRLAEFATYVFALSFLGNSFGGAKSLRYIAYAQPFLIIIWSLGIAALGAYLRGPVVEMMNAVAKSIGRDAQNGRRVTKTMLAVAGSVFVLANPAWLRTVTVLADIPVPPEIPPVDWRAARPILLPHVERATVVVTTEELGTYYFLGRFDFTVNNSRYSELAQTSNPLVIADPRTGRAVGRGIDTVKRIMGCFAPGIFVSPRPLWGAAAILDEESRSLVRTHGREIRLPPESGVVAFVWESRLDGAGPCEELRVTLAGR